MTDTVVKRLLCVEKLIEEACLKAHRDRSDVKLVAVSKGQDVQVIRQAYELGIRDFGENYVQELMAKIDFFHGLGMNDIRWHFLGALQSNKIKLIASKVRYIHSLSSLKHAQYLHESLTRPLSVFLQVNLESNLRRQGFEQDELLSALPKLFPLRHLAIEGLMTVLPLDPAFSHEYWFSKMAHLKDEILAQGMLKTVKLSMGMSDDFVDAIHYGSNYLRIGSGIFGPRKSQ